MPIHHLPPHIVAKIAAGEVIERPCYAVKELIENAIDAHATSIDIHIQNAGLDNITIIDNGDGITYEELPFAIERHTTSKIETEIDLQTIKTLGFRGEALASIAAVSKLTMRSKTKDGGKGGLLQSTFAQLSTHSPIGMAQGTHVIVEDLFGSLPARKKFFKSTALEYRYILEHITSHALTNPQIAWSLTHNDKHIFTLHANQNLLDRAHHLLGSHISSQLVPIEYQSDNIKISGFIGKPQIQTHTAQKQFIFLNNRRISSLAISNTARAAYGSLLEATAHPMFVINITIAPTQYDVNVHPRKETVFFYDQEQILQHISSAFTQSLAQHKLTYIDARWQKEDTENIKSLHHTHLKNTVSHDTAEMLREKVLTPYYGSSLKKNSDIIQLHNTYLISETENGILIVDQHAAHERVLYEKFLEAFELEKETAISYNLKKPLEISLSITDREIVMEFIHIFIKLGFKFVDGLIEIDDPTVINSATQSSNSQNILQIISVPNILKDHPIDNLIVELIDDLRNDKVPSLDIRSHRMLSYLACRSAIMAGDKLTKERSKLLLEELSQCKTEYTCPHGRPAKVELQLKNMHKLFKRL